MRAGVSAKSIGNRDELSFECRSLGSSFHCGTESINETLFGHRISRLRTAATSQLYLRGLSSSKDSGQDGLLRAVKPLQHYTIADNGGRLGHTPTRRKCSTKQESSDVDELIQRSKLRT